MADNPTQQISIRVGGNWSYVAPKVNVSGIWKTVTVYVKQENIWKTLN